MSLPKTEENKYLLQDQDLIFNRTNSAELVGKTAVYHEGVKAVFASYLIRFRLNLRSSHPDFVCLYINSRLGREYIVENMARAVGQVNISASKMHDMPIPVPLLTEQQQIAQGIEDKIAGVNLLEESVQQELETIEAMPSVLLRKAFSGEL